MKEWKAVIIEDSRLARKELKELLKRFPEICCIGEAENVEEAYTLITATNPDLLFLDIHLPEKDGFALLEMLDEIPPTIFTTAFDSYAIKSFAYNTLDYLLKPISQERFDMAIHKLMQSTEIGEKNAEKQTNTLDANKQIFIKEQENCWMVAVKNITMFEIVGNYTRVYFDTHKPLLYKSLTKIEDRLPTALFFRANRQQIININHIKNVVVWFNGKLKVEMLSGEEVQISRRQSHIFKEQLSL